MGLMSADVARAEPDAASSAWQKAKEDFARAYDSVKSGAHKTANAGQYAVQDLGKGLVRVTDKSKQALQKTGAAVEDSWISTKIKGQLAADAQLKATALEVATEHGVVRLTGKVASEAEAKRAIELALATNGVVAVDADLQFPSAYKHVTGHTPAGKQP
jgi:osmotically-inducible protein OsmY